MKRIEAIIQPHKLDETKEALKAIGVDALGFSMGLFEPECLNSFSQWHIPLQGCQLSL